MAWVYCIPLFHFCMAFPGASLSEQGYVRTFVPFLFLGVDASDNLKKNSLNERCVKKCVYIWTSAR